MKSKKMPLIIFGILALAGLLWWNFAAKRVGDLPLAPPPSTGSAVMDEVLEEAPLAASVAIGLEIPWSLDFLPDGGIVFTERPGRIRLIDAGEGLLPEPLLIIDEVSHVGEGGLLGIAVHPGFAENRFIYVYYTYLEGEGLANKVIRFKLEGENLVDKTTIIDKIPGAANHNGGRIKFGPDGLLYISTGDALTTEFPQDKESLGGKILRLKDDGAIPEDNPFPGSPVYSFGHRNPQGMAWDDQGRFWGTEHGSFATDEVNLIEAGKNYGWPEIRGDEKTIGFTEPVIHSGSETWAPSGAAFLDGSLYFVGLRGQSLYGLSTEDGRAELKRHFTKKFGRLRDVVVGPDGFLYLLTSNRDGRGLPTAEDDQIIRVNPEKL